ncbi:MAG: sulfurtransferase complex subunit TusB [Bradyrhizobiaceae bacterium]|nr:MAG: sulfurtransferase complex subunit TusB [Bradyrhizobiaceae bacterium]
MSTLHTVNKSPFERSAFSSALNHLKPGDAVLMIEDGVVGARKGSAFAGLLESAAKSCAIYVLEPDLAARGMGETDVIQGANLVDYGGFVDLVTTHQRTQAWL